MFSRRQTPFMSRLPGYGSAPARVVREPFVGPQHTLDKMAEHVLGVAGEQSFAVRQWTEFVVRGVCPKDYLGEILAIRNSFVQPSPFLNNGIPTIRYTNDPRHVELVKTPERIVREIFNTGTCLCDCDEAAELAATMCLQVGKNVDLIAMGFARNQLSHVAIRAQEPKSGVWILLDGVAGPREQEAAGRAVELLVKHLD